METLLRSLSTPSEQVQKAVCTCLAPLVPAVKAEAPAHIQEQLVQLVEGHTFGERRGAAYVTPVVDPCALPVSLPPHLYSSYGLAGFVKGMGVLALRQQGVMETLKTYITNKKSAAHREGALMAFELLCITMGRLFEP